MFPKILITIVVLVVIFVVVVALQPSTFRIVRTASIPAPASVVFAQVNDFHRMVRWSPWSKMDPTMKSTFSGPPAGVGASYAWVGNSNVGEGRLTIVESEPYQRIRYQQEFFKPMKAENNAEFTFREEGGQTVVTWTMYGDQSFAGKAISLFVSMDKMMGKTFEEGLANLRAQSTSDRNNG